MSSKDAPEEPEMIPDHESPVRHMLSAAHGTSFEALRSLDEARQAPDGVVVLEGDWGGQIYLVCPASLVGCSDAALKALLDDLDVIAWPPDGEPEGRGIYYERHAIGEGIPGGMGGGVVTEGLWIHEEFEDTGLRSAIEAVLIGDRARLSD
jgi:hypothetical protein